jgi:acyl-coenzyme A synthetase/AMP-(fatty) acid ligase
MDDTMRVFRGEWCVTGDMLRRKTDGTFTYCGRTDEMLKVHGRWLAPAEVENCLLAHPAVQEVVAVGASDADGLVAVCAFVVAATASPPPVQELQAFAKARLEHYKVPRDIVFMESLPRTHLGKIDRGALARRRKPQASSHRPK